VSRRTWLVVVTVAVAVLAVLTVALARVSLDSRDDLTKGPEVPPVGTRTEPVCPAYFGEDVSPPNTRKGPLLPTGATDALLCSYRFAAPNPMPLTATHRITSGAEAAVTYLNGLTASQPKPFACLLNGTTQHVMVFGYADRPAAVVYVRGCALDQAGAVRYGGDVRKETGFWQVPWNQ
jgi:hypothetical protein